MNKNNKINDKHSIPSAEQKDLTKTDDVSIKTTKTKKSKKQKPLIIVLDIAIVVLFALGIYFLAKPYYVAYKQDQKMEDLRNLVRTDEPKSTEGEGTSSTLPGIWVDSGANAVAGEKIERFTVDGDGYERSVVDANSYDLPEQVYLELLGLLQIDAIDLDLPLLVGAKVVPLRYGAGWYEASSPIGEKGRATILGHASSYNRRFFTNLPKLEVGDKIRIVQDNRTLHYDIYKIDYIPADELGYYLTDSDVDSEIMLVSCYPRPTWEQRILVYAKLVDTESKN
jgi:LPXTG-site transpeptidase (sortase) family protein